VRAAFAAVTDAQFRRAVQRLVRRSYFVREVESTAEALLALGQQALDGVLAGIASIVSKISAAQDAADAAASLRVSGQQQASAAQAEIQQLQRDVRR
jgi:hypothetical protein